MAAQRTISLDPGWYADPYGAAVERYHDGSQWTGRIRVPGSTVEQMEPTVRMRPVALRTLVATCVAVLTIGLYFAAILLPFYFGPYFAGASLLFVGAWALFVGLVGPKAGYSPAYIFVMFIPFFGFVGMAAVTTTITRRLMLLPYRTWEVPAAELPMWLRIRDPKNPDGLLYVRRTW